MSDPGSPDPLLGALVADRYRVEALLGVGGIGRVYRALHIGLNRPVALKLLHPAVASRPDMAERFQREARAASLLDHRGSVTVHDFGTWDGRLFIAMELVVGRTLDRVIARDHPLEPDRVVALMTQLCDVLAAAHRQGLLHRDLKPENIIVATDPGGRDHIKVVDFGLAVLMQEDMQQRLTQDGAVSGTPAYMSPEQALAKPLDARSDLYSVGCILYEVLTGTAPFEAASAVECLAMHLYDEPEPPSSRCRVPIDRALETTALWCLEKNPLNRPQSADELKVALQEAVDRPSESELLARAIAQTATSREARAVAAGIAPTRPAPRPGQEVGDLRVLLVEPYGVPFAESALPVLRAQGGDVLVVRRPVHAALEHVPAATQAVVVDIRDDAHRALDAVGAWLAAGGAGAAPVVVVGADDAMDAMTRALSVGVADYVPASDLTKLARAVRRHQRPTRG
ncbi:MAG: serine/threonine protein kinase [Myxococcales bacterium]|nr:serine/threonine protein kinase [Myxococcales bacterium]